MRVRTFRSNAFQRHQLRYSCLSVYLNCGPHTECCSLVNSWWSSFPWALHALRNPPLDGSQIAWPIGVCKSHFDHFFSLGSQTWQFIQAIVYGWFAIKASIYRWFAHQFSHQSFHQKSGLPSFDHWALGWSRIARQITGTQTSWPNMLSSWLVVYLPLWKIWHSKWNDEIPNIWKR